MSRNLYKIRDDSLMTICYCEHTRSVIGMVNYDGEGKSFERAFEVQASESYGFAVQPMSKLYTQSDEITSEIEQIADTIRLADSYEFVHVVWASGPQLLMYISIPVLLFRPGHVVKITEYGGTMIPTAEIPKGTELSVAVDTHDRLHAVWVGASCEIEGGVRNDNTSMAEATDQQDV